MATVLSDPIGEEGETRHTPEYLYNSDKFLFDIEGRNRHLLPKDCKYVLVEYNSRKRRAFVPLCCIFKSVSRHTAENLHQALRGGFDMEKL